MRQLKYFVRGQKGNIEVTKGTFLNLKKKNSKKIINKKIVIQTKGTQKKKLVIKQIKRKIRIDQNSSPEWDTKNRFESRKQCPDTAESLKQANSEYPITSQFCILDNPEVFQIQHRPIYDSCAIKTEEKPNNWVDTKSNNCESTRTAQGLELNFHDSKSQNTIVNEDIYDKDEFQICEQSSWSMINQHVEHMKITLSLGYFDYIYGKTTD